MDKREILIRVGIPEYTESFTDLIKKNWYSSLISASAFWGHRHFKIPPDNMRELDIALDSAGFVAMVNPKWGGKYPWSVKQYCALSDCFPWSGFVAQMDACCEKEIAENRQEI